MNKENFIVENNATFLEFSIDKELFFEDKEVVSYLEEVSDIDFLTLEQQDELIKRKLNGDKEARDKLIKNYLYLSVIIASKYSFLTSSITNMDLISEASIALMQAVDDYLLSFGNFYKFLVKQMNSHLIKVCKVDGKTISVPITGKESYYDSIEWLNMMEEQYKILYGVNISEISLISEWEEKNGHVSILDSYNPDYRHLQEFRMSKYKVSSKLRKGIDSLDAYNYEDVIGEDITFNLDEIIMTRKIQETMHFIINNYLNEIERKIMIVYLKNNKIPYKQLSHDLNISVPIIRKYASRAIRKMKYYLYQELHNDVSYVKRIK